MADLDAIYALLYHIKKEDLRYILNTFTVLKNFEISEYGSYQTEKLILDSFDKFSKKTELFK